MEVPKKLRMVRFWIHDYSTSKTDPRTPVKGFIVTKWLQSFGSPKQLSLFAPTVQAGSFKTLDPACQPPLFQHHQHIAQPPMTRTKPSSIPRSQP